MVELMHENILFGFPIVLMIGGFILKLYYNYKYLKCPVGIVMIILGIVSFVGLNLTKDIIISSMYASHWL